MKYDKSAIMKNAWVMFKKGTFATFSECLKQSWADAFCSSLFDDMFKLPDSKPVKKDYSKVQAPKTYFNGDPYWHVMRREFGGVR